MTKDQKLIDSLELTEAAGLTTLREATTRWFSARALAEPEGAKLIQTPIMLKLGFLTKGTKTTKTLKGVQMDIVLKPYEINEVTKDGKTTKVITLNERIGLTETSMPLDHNTRVMRCIGAVCTALADLTIPAKLNKAGNPIKTREHNEALKDAGFNKWNEPLDHGKRFAAKVSPKVDFAIDAFELPEAPEKDEDRITYKAVIRDENDKELKALVCPKALYDTYKGKEHVLRISFMAINSASADKANKLAKDTKRAIEAEKDEATKTAELTKLNELIESFN